VVVYLSKANVVKLSHFIPLSPTFLHYKVISLHFSAEKAKKGHISAEHQNELMARKWVQKEIIEFTGCSENTFGRLSKTRFDHVQKL
jgi:hypothetical protein